LSIFTASTGPSDGTRSPVNGENSWLGASAAGFTGVPGPGRGTAMITAISPITATAAEMLIMTFRRGHLTTPTSRARLVRPGILTFCMTGLSTVSALARAVSRVGS
jgi:hypothetical protein